MKPTDQQKQWLQDYLRAVLTYRETYEEVYDHVLLALENKPSDDFFETSVMSIIDDDFDGNNGLLTLEKTCKKVAVEEVENNYRKYFFLSLKFPLVLYSIGLGLLTYYVIKQLKPINVMWVLIAIFLIPVMLLSIRAFKIGRKFGDTKISLKDNIFSRVAYRHFFILYFMGWCLSIINAIIQFILRRPLRANGFTALLYPIIITLLMIHAFSVFKSYKEEFKVKINN